MLYHAFDMQKSWLAGASALATAGAQAIQHPANPLGYFSGSPMFASALEVFAHASAPRGKPRFDLYETEVDGEMVRVTEVVEARKPFGQLKHFKHKGASKAAGDAPKLLIVAPMSGHYATLLRGTVERMLPGHDVWITDWRDARNAPLTAGKFDLDDYVDYLIDWMEHIGPGAHMLAVCQPSVPSLAAAAIMAADKNKCRPATLTMMGGPIDTRKAPTAVNMHATNRPYAWFGENVIATVPAYYPGAGRQVYPGFLQLAGFMSMNLGNHMMSHWEMFKHLVDGDGEGADKTKEFYDEYRAVCDMTAEFYLQTVDVVFQRHLLPKGEYLHHGKPVDLGAIEDIALLAVEGERDDISGLGQTKAALTLAKNLPAADKKYLMAKGVGHYGIFNGRKWRDEIAPVLEDWIRAHGG